MLRTFTLVNGVYLCVLMECSMDVLACVTFVFAFFDASVAISVYISASMYQSGLTIPL